ncbi:MAG: M48 family metalloprotease, partial [Candidatus Tectomicrobia bacterium]|nr:M48 family metalloprotease [Candidatus Tectomicrobia bacterium]
CGGIWLDAGERAKLDKATSTNVATSIDRAAQFSARSVTRPDLTSPPSTLPVLPRLPNLAFRSTVVLLSLYLYGMVFLALLVAVEVFRARLQTAIFWSIVVLVLQYLLAPFLMDLRLRFQSGRWVSKEELPPHLHDFIQKVCSAKRISFPYIGIIQDGNPNTFTYGHYPGNARLVLTSGLIEILEEDELEAVVGHELGHVLHWDIVVMTVASLVPMILYYFYRNLRYRVRSGQNRDERETPLPLHLIAILCYIFYLISEYLLLFLSRGREYYADRFSGQITKNPNALISALVKIAYGLVAAKPEEAKEKGQSPLRDVRALGIFDPQAALHLAVTTGGERGFSKENAVEAMQWDLWNPWAIFYELSSTHPLPAKRIKALGDLAWHHQQRPLVNFNMKRPESYWDEFFVDLFIMVLPPLLLLATLVLIGPEVVIPQYTSLIWTMSPNEPLEIRPEVARAPFAVLKGVLKASGTLIAALGIGYLIQLLFSYPRGPFSEASVASLLKKVKVSSVRAVPVILKGKIIGRGIPGLIYSENLVLQDETGFIFLDYQQPLRLIELLFGLFRTPMLIGQEVVVEGWYRRAIVPYVEMKSLSYGRAFHRCYVYPVKLTFYIFLLILGIGMMVAGS